jgi:hypothetical protein
MDRICKGFDPAEFQKKIEISITTAAYSYAFPTTDTSAATIRLKSFKICRIKQTSETYGHPLVILDNNTKDMTWPIMDSTITGRPKVMSIIGETIELYPWPDDTYTLYAWVNVFPNYYTSATLGNDTPFNDEWDEVIEAFATHDCFAKLQQGNDAASWFGIWKNAFRNTVATIRRRTPIVQDMTLRDIPVGISPDYARDPFVRSMP